MTEPAPIVVTGGLAGHFDGHDSRPTDGVRRALGREPRDVATAMAEAFATAGAR
jgi:hypothetical protein